MLGVRDEVVAYVLDEALAIRLAEFERDARAVGSGPFSGLDRVLKGHGPRRTPDGLHYQDPKALYREEMARRAAESGQVH